MAENNLHRLLLTKTEELPFPVIAINALKVYGIENLGELVKFTKLDILKIRYMGCKSVNIIEDFLYKHGLSFGMDVKELHKQNSDSIDVITHLIKSKADISITIKLNDLLQFANHLIRSTKEELEDSILTKNEETYITPDEASIQLHVDRSTLWRWAKSGYLIPVGVGGKRLYKQSDIDIILDK